MRLLFVDDDEVTLFLYRRLVKNKTGVQAHYARNAREALDWIANATEPYDAVFLDINMPVMDGYEFLRHHEELPAGKARNIYLMLGTEISDGRREASLHSGVTDFVPKPLRDEKFSSLLASIGR